jgi:hypothetical protein
MLTFSLLATRLGLEEWRWMRSLLRSKLGF